ncbi:plasmolipin-like [Paramormyrops kingsleyae]|uniref:Plasmolipin n=1 Tax=Paramormyrops kingsleyae TaxID=1676925 RepID=A0A3B3QIA3_9TELE|nr:plasmolipin-like [Paramormyrops kingsleyae]XP_023675526.1 plasmolipin-like [Paramormyrops kingsleyae]
MADFPGKVNTETSTPSSHGAGGGRVLGFASRYVSMDMLFIRTIPAILMLVEIVLGLLVWALISSTQQTLISAYGWVMFVSVILWILTIVLFWILFLGLQHKLNLVPWQLVVLVFNGVATVLYLTAFIANAASVTPYSGSTDYNHLAAAAFFGILVTLTYAASTFFAYMVWKEDGGNAANSTIPE